MEPTPEEAAGGRATIGGPPAVDLHHLAALARAAGAVLRLGEALALAGILALAGVGRALARALALAGVRAVALHSFGVGSGDERAGGEDRGGGGDQCTLGHEEPPGRASIGLASGYSPGAWVTLRRPRQNFRVPREADL